jgi:hypothetical protein
MVASDSSLRVLCLFALMGAIPHNPDAAIFGIVVLGLSEDSHFWGRLGSVATITAGGLAIRLRRP